MSEKIWMWRKTPNKETNRQTNKQTSWLSFGQLCGLPTCVFIFYSVQIHYNTWKIQYNALFANNGASGVIIY